MKKVILKKFIIAIFATLIWCLLLSAIGYTPIGEQEHNSYHMTFTEYFMLHLIFIAPMFLTVGVLFSIVVEMKNKSIFKTVFTYVIGGGVVGFLYYLLIVNMQASTNILSDEVMLSIILGASSALFFYGVQNVLNSLLSKLSLN